MIIVPDSSCAAAISETLRAEVQKVFDGDGFLARVWNPHRRKWVERVPFRLAFIDAPEAAQPFGLESRDFLERLVADKSLKLAPVLKGSTKLSPLDSYHRLLCVPYLTELMQVGRVDYFINGCCGSGVVRQPRSVTRNIELEMVVNGWAWVLRQYSFDCEAEYLQAETDARRHRRGLWSVDNPEPPWSFKRRNQRVRQRHAGQHYLF